MLSAIDAAAAMPMPCRLFMLRRHALSRLLLAFADAATPLIRHTIVHAMPLLSPRFAKTAIFLRHTPHMLLPCCFLR